MDMVPQKDLKSTHNFETDPIETWIDGEWVRAKGTTLGADNGMGVAAIMAIMEDNTLKHGPLEALITADEETGMFGVTGLPEGELEGTILLNLDTEDEGELIIGSAGGVDITATLDYKEVETDKTDIAVAVTVKGLKGGHSGLESVWAEETPTRCSCASFARQSPTTRPVWQHGTEETCVTPFLLRLRQCSQCLRRTRKTSWLSALTSRRISSLNIRV